MSSQQREKHNILQPKGERIFLNCRTLTPYICSTSKLLVINLADNWSSRIHKGTSWKRSWNMGRGKETPQPLHELKPVTVWHISYRLLQDWAVYLNANLQPGVFLGIKVLRQAAVLEISECCWIFSIHVLKSSGRLSNVREQTTALTMLCCEFFGHVPLSEFSSDFSSFVLISETKGHCLWFIHRVLIKGKFKNSSWLKIFFKIS